VENKGKNMKKQWFLGLLAVLCAFPLLLAAQGEKESETLAHYTPILSSEFKSELKTADAVAGEEYFMRKCSSCHDEVKSSTHGKGPNLWNIMGRKAGSAAGFAYSDAMKQSGHTWNYASLNYYLTNTKRAVPGRIMNFKGIRKQTDRVKLLLFLRSMADNPAPLP
jgi:cytochrome c